MCQIKNLVFFLEKQELIQVGVEKEKIVCTFVVRFILVLHFRGAY